MRKLISSGSKFEALAGYSRAVAQGDWVFVSGTTGRDPKTDTYPEGVEAQAENALAIIGQALAEADATMADVVRVHVYLADPADAPKVLPIMGRVFGAIRPANTTICTPLLDPSWKIEIEVTALKGGRA
jgi:enamine deaminase RidA (YjgF/YER057c/UK114 family)